MNASRLGLNRLQKPNSKLSNQWHQHQYRPSPHVLGWYDDSDGTSTEELVESMQDCIMAGLAEMQGHDMPPMLADDPAYETIFDPVPGRCLWTLDTLIQLKEVKEDPTLINTAILENLALKPSEDYPAELQEVTPRFALAITGMRVAEFVRVARWLTDQRVTFMRPNKWDVYAFMKPLCYGGHHDDDLETVELPNMPSDDLLPPRNSKRSAVQQFAILHCPKDKGFAAGLLAAKPFAVDLGPELHKMFMDAAARLKQLAALAKANSKREPASPYLHDIWHKVETWNLALLEVEVVPFYMTGTWDFEKLYTEQLTPQQHIKLSLVRTMAQIVYKGALWRYQQPYTVLALSLCTGISPAIFVRSAIKQLERTGITFLSETHVEAIAHEIRGMEPARAPSAQSRREALVKELRSLLTQYIEVQDNLPAARVDEAIRTTSSPGFMAWGIGEADADGLDDD